MKLSKLTSAIALLLILIASSCSTMEDPLSQDQPAAFEVSPSELQGRTNRISIELEGTHSVDCKYTKTADQGIIDLLVPGDETEPKYGQQRAWLTYEDERTKLAYVSLVEIRETGDMQVQSNGKAYESKLNAEILEDILKELCGPKTGGNGQNQTQNSGIVPMQKVATSDANLASLLDPNQSSNSNVSPAISLLDQLTFLHGSWELETESPEVSVKLSWERTGDHFLQGYENYLNATGVEEANEWYIKQEGNNLKLIIATQHAGEALIMENGIVKEGKVTFYHKSAGPFMQLELSLSENKQLVAGIEIALGEDISKSEFVFNRTGN